MFGNIILTRLEDDVTFSSHILTVVSPSVLPKHQPGVGRCPMYPLLLLVTDRKPSGHLDVIWSPRVTRLGHIDDSFYNVGKSPVRISHTIVNFKSPGKCKENASSNVGAFKPQKIGCNLTCLDSHNKDLSKILCK